MALRNYGVLTGHVVDRRREGGMDSPHYQIHIRAAGTDFRVAVNVLSAQSPSELLYIADEDFHHPLLAQLSDVAEGFTALPGQPGGAALDFVRGNLFDRLQMRPVPAEKPGPDNDLADHLDHFVQRASTDPQARVFAFGERWPTEPRVADKIFGFLPGNGVHDVHMNQGNSGQFQRDDGVWQDGGLLLHFPGDQWVAVFLAFQSQAWHTDDQTGHPLPEIPHGPGPKPLPGEPDHRGRIVGALVNPVGPAPEAETVTLLNASPDPVDLTDWMIADAQKNRVAIGGGTLPAGDALAVRLAPPVQLGNHGGLITLLDPRGIKIDGVAYTADQTRDDGWTIVF